MIAVSIIYIVSFIVAWLGTRAYRKNKWGTPSLSDVFFVVCPFLNTIAAMYYFEHIECKIDTSWFFGLKVKK